MATTTLFFKRLPVMSRSILNRSLCQATHAQTNQPLPFRFELVPSNTPGCQIMRFLVNLVPDPPKTSFVNFRLKHILLDQGNHSIVTPLLAQLFMYGFIPDLTTFIILIESYCRNLEYQQAVDAISTQMKALEVDPNGSFYKSLGNELCAGVGPESGYQLLQKLRANHIIVPIPYYHALVTDFCEKKKLYEGGLVVMNMEQQRDETFATFLEEFFTSFSREDLPEAITTLRSRMAADHVKIRIAMLNSFLGLMSRFGLLEEAVKMFDEYKEMGTFQLDEIACGYALNCFCKLGNMDEAINLFKEMKANMMDVGFLDCVALVEGYQRLQRLDYIRTIIAAYMEKVNVNWCSSGQC